MKIVREFNIEMVVLSGMREGLIVYYLVNVQFLRVRRILEEC